jgi:rubrerythrin
MLTNLLYNNRVSYINKFKIVKKKRYKEDCMPEFSNPFSGIVPERTLSKQELIRAIRLNLAAEEEAANIYMTHAEATDDTLARKVLVDIADEERVHAGEFQRLLQILTGDEDQLLKAGAGEKDEMSGELER